MERGRYEYKFLVSPEAKARILEAVAEGVEPDPHGEDGAYQVTSLYYDTADRRAFYEKLDGVPIRHKFRLRHYGEKPESTFMEIKSRHYQTVHKSRIPLDKETFEKLLEEPDFMRELPSPGPRHHEAVDFIRLRSSQYRMLPAITIGYRREAYVGRHHERLRLTFDHLCQAYRAESYPVAPDQVGCAFCPREVAVMEVKFDHRLPGWMRDAVGLAQVRPVRMSKYVEGCLARADVEQCRRVSAVNWERVSL